MVHVNVDVAPVFGAVGMDVQDSANKHGHSTHCSFVKWQHVQVGRTEEL